MLRIVIYRPAVTKLNLKTIKMTAVTLVDSKVEFRKMVILNKVVRNKN